MQGHVALTIKTLFLTFLTNITKSNLIHSFMSSSSMASLKSTPLIMFSLLILLQFSIANSHGGSIDEQQNDAAPATGDLHSRSLILVKVWCLIILFVSTFAGGVSAYFFRWNQSFLLLGTQFAGGVFLGTSLMHFLSDSNSTFGDLTDKEYPFAFMLASFGYLLTMFGDFIVLLVTKGSGGHGSKVEVEEVGRIGHHDEESGSMDLNPGFLTTESLGDTILLILALCFHSVLRVLLLE